MIRLMVKLGKWLDSRFPEKVIVTTDQYLQLHAELGMLRSQVQDLSISLNTALERLSVVEANAVHKGAVSDLVLVVKELKDDYASFKASMGFVSKPASNKEIEAMLNGEII